MIKAEILSHSTGQKAVRRTDVSRKKENKQALRTEEKTVLPGMTLGLAHQTALTVPPSRDSHRPMIIPL